MEGEGEGWASSQWRRDRDSGRGGGYASGRSGPRDNYNRSHNQYGDRQQQGNFQRERGAYHQRGQGRQYGSYGQQQREGFPGHHADQQHEGYPQHDQREQHQLGFRGPVAGPHFDTAEGRAPGFMNYGQEPMMAMPQRMPEYWAGPAGQYHHPQVSVQGPGMHAPFTRLAGPPEQQQYPIAQPYLQHPVAGGHHGAGMGMGAGGAVGIGGGTVMQGQMYHPNAPRPQHHAGAWASGGSGYRNQDAARGGGGGPGRGGGGGGGGGEGGGGPGRGGGGPGRGSGGPGRGGGGGAGVSAGSSAARNVTRAPHVPQPLVPNASARVEPVNSGMNSLGRPRQQPSSTVNNVQSSRGPPAETAQAPGAGSGAKAEPGHVGAPTQQPADSSSTALPVAAAAGVEAGPVMGGATADLCAEEGGARPVSATGDAQPQGAAPTGPLDSVSPTTEASLAAGSVMGPASGSGSSDSSSGRNDKSVSPSTPSASAVVPSVCEAPAAGPSPSGLQANHAATAEGPAALPSTLLSSPVPPASPQPEAPGAGPTATQQQPAADKPPAPAVGSAWKQRPAAALFTAPVPPAGAHGPVRKAGAPASHAPTLPQGSAGGAAAAVAAGAQSAGVAAGVSATNAGSHPHQVPSAPASAAMGPPPRLQNRPAPVQTGAAQHPRSPPPGFGAAPVVSPLPAGSGTPPLGHVTPSPPPPQHQQLSPRASAGSERAEPAAGSPAQHALSQQQQQHSPTVEGPTSPAPVDAVEASKAGRKWALVAAAPRGSGGGAPAKPPPRRPISEGGGSSADPSAAAAAATLVGFRHTAHQPPGFASGPPAVAAAADAANAASTGDVNSKALGRPESTQAPGPATEAASVAPASAVDAQAGEAKDVAAPAAAGAEAAPQATRSSTEAEGPAAAAAVPRTRREPAAVAAASGAATAAAAAVATLTSPPRDAVVTAMGAAASALTTSPRETVKGQPSVANGAAAAPSQAVDASASSPEARGPRTWASLAVSGLDGKRLPTVPAVGLRNAVAGPPGSVVQGTAGPAPAAPGTGSAAAAVLSRAVTDTSAGQPQQVTAETGQRDAAASGASAAPGTEGSAAGPEAAVAPKPAATAANTEPPQAATAAAVAESAPAAGPPAPRSWAALAAKPVLPSGSAPQSDRGAAARSVHGIVPATAVSWGRSPSSQGRGAGARGARHAAAPPRGMSAQPPEVLFQPYVAAAPAQGKVAEDAHGGAGLSPAPSSKLSTTTTTPAQLSPASPLSPAAVATATVEPAAAAVATTEPSTASAAAPLAVQPAVALEPAAGAAATAATTEPPQAASAAVVAELAPEQPAPAAGPPAPRSWAALAAKPVLPSGSAPQSDRGAAVRSVHGIVPATAVSWGRSPSSQGRGAGARGARHAAAPPRGMSAQPPEVLFQPYVAAAPAQGKVAEDAHGGAGLSPAPSSKLSTTTTTPEQPSPASPLSPAAVTTATVEPAAPAAATTEPSTASAAAPVDVQPAAALAGAAVPAAPSASAAPHTAQPAATEIATPATAAAALGDAADAGPAAGSEAAATLSHPGASAAPAAPEVAAPAPPKVAPAPEAPAPSSQPPPQQQQQQNATPAEMSGGGSAARADKEAAAPQQPDGNDQDSWHQVPARHKASKGARVADAGHAHPSLNAGPGAGSGAGRGRGRHGDATAGAPGPHQRAAGAPDQQPQQGGRGRGAAGQQPQHGSQPSTADGKPRAVASMPTPAPTAASVQPTTMTGGVGAASPSATASSANADGQAGAGVVAAPAAAPAPAPAPAAAPAPAQMAPEVVPATGAAEVTTEAHAVPDGQAEASAPVSPAPAPAPSAVAPADMEPSTAHEIKVTVEAAAPSGGTTLAAAEGVSEVTSEPPAATATAAATEEAAVQMTAPQPQQLPPQPQSVPAPGDVKEKKGGTAAVQETPKKEEVEEEEEEEAAALPAGNNPWDLLGAAGEDGEVAAVAAAAAVAVRASAPAAGSSEADLADALRQLLTPVTVEQLQAAGRQLAAGGLRIQPRGLANTGNTCFINSTMQALLGCAPFAAVLSRLPAVMPLLERTKSPTLYGLAEFSTQLAAPQWGTAASGANAAGGREESHAAEADGWAEVPSGRGKKGSNRKSTSAYPGHNPQAAAVGPAAAAPVAAAAASSSAGAAASGPAAAAASMAALLSGKPLVPSMLNPIVAAFNPRISIAAAAPPTAGGSAKPSMVQMLSKGAGGRSGAALVEPQEQQDAQEFFQFLVNRAHEEVVALRKAHGLAEPSAEAAGASSVTEAGGGDIDEWAQVGRKNKATVTRQVGCPSDDAFSRSPVSAIFSGSLKSTVRFQQPHAHYKPSATVEAFNMLHLDIATEGVGSLEDALRQHSVPESIEYKPDGATQMLPAKKDVRLYRLPECLVLHLKRFTYTAAGGGGYSKLLKPVAFGSSLRLEGKILAEDCPDRANSEYRLFATVIHHGRNIAGGHYIADVLQPDGRWLRFNDAEVSLVPESCVLAEKPYLLFYQRLSQPQRGA